MHMWMVWWICTQVIQIQQPADLRKGKFHDLCITPALILPNSRLINFIYFQMYSHFFKHILRYAFALWWTAIDFQAVSDCHTSMAYYQTFVHTDDAIIFRKGSAVVGTPGLLQSSIQCWLKTVTSAQRYSIIRFFSHYQLVFFFQLTRHSVHFQISNDAKPIHRYSIQISYLFISYHIISSSAS